MLGLRCHVGADAAVKTSLPAPVLSAEETRAFENNDVYLSARHHISSLWRADCTKLLSLEACAAALPGDVPASLSSVLPDAWRFLQEHGAINFGVLPDVQPVAAPSEPEAAAPPAPPPKRGPTNKELLTRLYEYLKTVDFNEVTEKRIRKTLAAEFGADLEDRKAMIRRHVTHVIEHLEDAEPPPPLDFEAEEGDDDVAAAAAVAAVPEGAAALASKAPQRVVVVGASLAGLAAATVLKVNGVSNVVVLDAKEDPVTSGSSCSSSSSAWDFLFNDVPPAGGARETMASSAEQAGQAVTGGTQHNDQAAWWLVQQLGMSVSGCDLARVPLLDGRTGDELDADVDKRAEGLRDAVLDGIAVAAAGRRHGSDVATAPSLAAAVSSALSDRKLVDGKQIVDGNQVMEAEATDGHKTVVRGEADGEAAGDGNTLAVAAGSDDVMRALKWHWSYLETAVGGTLEQLSTSYAARHMAGGTSRRQAELGSTSDESAGRSAPQSAAFVVDGVPALESALASRLDVRGGTRVVRVQYGEAGVKLTSASGDVTECSSVVLAVPLGALRDITFVPPLPEWKRHALAALGWQAQASVTLHLPNGLDALHASCRPPAATADAGGGGCSSSCSVFGVLPAVATDPSCCVFSVRAAAGGPASGTGGPAGSGTSSTSVTAHVTGRQVAELTDAQLQELAAAALRPALVDADGTSTASAGAVRRYWRAFVAAGGGTADSSAAAAAGGTVELVKAAVACPVGRQLLFAGPHTSDIWPPGAELQAALSSGLREAARVIKCLRGEAALAVGDEVARVSTEVAVAAADSGPHFKEEKVIFKKHKRKPDHKPTTASDGEPDQATKKAKAGEEGGGGSKAKKASAKATAEKPQKKRKKDESDDEDGDVNKWGSEDSDDEDDEREMEKEEEERRARKAAKAAKEKAGGDKGDGESGGEKKEKKKRKKQRAALDGDGGVLGSRKPSAVPEVYDERRTAEAEKRHRVGRQDIKLYWQAAIKAQSGDWASLQQLLTNATDLDSRQQSLQVLVSSGPQLTDKIIGVSDVLQLLCSWVPELSSDTSASHLLLQLLQLLHKLPTVPPEVLAAFRMVPMLRTSAILQHRDKEVKTAALQLLQKWAPPPPAAAARAGSGGGGSAAEGGAAAKGPGRAGSGGSAAAAGPTAGLDLLATQGSGGLFDGDRLGMLLGAASVAPLYGEAAVRAAEIAETEARLVEARQAAAAITAERAASVSSQPQPGEVNMIRSFHEFRKQVTKANGASNKANGGGSNASTPGGTSGSRRPASTAGHPDASASGRGQAAGGASTSAAAASTGLSADMKRALKEATQAAVYAHERKKEIDARQSKEIFKKVFSKVSQSIAGKTDVRKTFNHDRKEKIKGLVEKYVQQLKGRR